MNIMNRSLCTNLFKLEKNLSFSKLTMKNIFSKNNRTSSIQGVNVNGREMNSFKYSYNQYSIKKFSTETEETHSDFKPKVKQEVNEENVMKLIDEWVKGNDVVLFMKGTREMPRCGFSNYVVQILNFYKIKSVKTVNILEGATLREAVKQYSNWPTYPQLYVKGSLVGGCDIIKEMHENGTFKEMVEREGLNKAE